MTKFQKGGVRILALFTVLAVLLMTLSFVPLIKAAQVTDFSDTISDSDLGVVADHTIEFATPTGVDASTDTITITFGAVGNFSAGTVEFGDMDLEIDAACDGTYEISKTLAATAGVSPTWGAVIAGDPPVITLTAPTDAASGEIAADACVKVEVGLNATGGDAQLTNPSSAASYDIVIGGVFGDSGTAKIAIIDDVTVTATVSSTLTFVVAAVDSGVAINTDTNTTITSTATTIPFSTLTANTPAIGGHTLTVETNADDGFVVTVQQNQDLTSGVDADIDCFKDGSPPTPPTAWTSPLGTLGTESTYGHFGFTSEDSDLNGDEFGAALYAGFDGTTADEVFSHNGPADGSAADEGSTKVGYKVEIDELQEAGDYTNTLTYICTPTY